MELAEQNDQYNEKANYNLLDKQLHSQHVHVTLILEPMLSYMPPAYLHYIYCHYNCILTLPGLH